MAVEGHELADQLTAVLDGDSHSVVDVLKHLRTLRHRHLGRSKFTLWALIRIGFSFSTALALEEEREVRRKLEIFLGFWDI